MKNEDLPDCTKNLPPFALRGRPFGCFSVLKMTKSLFDCYAFELKYVFYLPQDCRGVGLVYVCDLRNNGWLATCCACSCFLLILMQFNG